MLTNDELERLYQREAIYRENSVLKSLAARRNKGDMSPTIVWEPPKVGSDVLILAHYNGSRAPVKTENDYFMEWDYRKRFIIYHVESYEIYSDYFYSRKNHVVLSFQIGKYKQTRRMSFLDFTSGLYEAEELNAQQVEEIRKYRKDLEENGNYY